MDDPAIRLPELDEHGHTSLRMVSSVSHDSTRWISPVASNGTESNAKLSCKFLFLIPLSREIVAPTQSGWMCVNNFVLFSSLLLTC